MPTDGTLEINYPMVIRQVTILSEQASKLRSCAAALHETEQRLQKNWHSDAARCYIQKTAFLREKLTRQAATVQSASETLYASAVRIYEAEQSAVEIALK